MFEGSCQLENKFHSGQKKSKICAPIGANDNFSMNELKISKNPITMRPDSIDVIGLRHWKRFYSWQRWKMLLSQKLQYLRSNKHQQVLAVQRRQFPTGRWIHWQWPRQTHRSRRVRFWKSLSERSQKTNIWFLHCDLKNPAWWPGKNSWSLQSMQGKLHAVSEFSDLSGMQEVSRR